MSAPKVTYQPGPAAASSQLARFVEFARARTQLELADWPALHRWSTEHYRDFWRCLVEFLSPVCEGELEPVCTSDEVERARFFPELRLNYAENLLRQRGDAALPDDGEKRVVLSTLDEAGTLVQLTRAELRGNVLSLAQGLEARGIGSHSRVAALARNDSAAVTACLASASLGASWSSVSPDLGVDSVLSRFGALAPELLFAHTKLLLQGQTRPLSEFIERLLQALPSVKTLVLLDDGELGFTPAVPVLRLAELVQGPARAGFTRVPFDHPLFILFSSGTTGVPKCIVHGHGGTLLEHLKELVLHTDLTREDAICFVTSTGWMMWNWLVSGLATEAEVVLYDGSVSFPESDSLLKHLAERKVTVFGTSPAYLRFLQDSEIIARERCDLGRLRAVLSTGSILYPEQFDFVQQAFGDLPLQSISGGTDILGCFVLGNPVLPVYRGESQCVSLGHDVRARDGAENLRAGTGELVCVRPFPSRPVGLYGDPEGTRFHDAYFSQHEDVWTHGDLIALTERGSARILGRSDGVLNIRGIRIGPAEIYGIVGRIPEVAEAMAVDQDAPNVAGGKKLVLLLVLKPGVVLDRPLTFRIKRELKEKASPVHVPDVVVQVQALPQTHNGKRSERAVQDLLSGRRPRNLTAIKNPEALHALLEIAELGVAPDLLAAAPVAPVPARSEPAREPEPA
ncbi:MAG: acetoacetate--CoA ligase [Myxococcales bacterium]